MSVCRFQSFIENTIFVEKTIKRYEYGKYLMALKQKYIFIMQTHTVIDIRKVSLSRTIITAKTVFKSNIFTDVIIV